MKIFDRIQAIIDKWIHSMTIDDQFDLIKCYDELLQLKAEFKDKAGVKDQEIKDFEAQRTLELKEEKDDSWKKKYTEVEIKSLITQEKQKMQSDANIIAFTLEKLDWKQKAVFSYITCVRDRLRPSVFLTQWDQNVQ